jgi:C-terminal processing protease CtpA/Prc
MPFKFSKRAQLVGETTAGSFSSTNFTQFENGMVLNAASVCILYFQARPVIV